MTIIEEDYLATAYGRLAKNPNDRLGNIKFYHSDVYYIRYHLQEKFDRAFTLAETLALLREEGLLTQAQNKLFGPAIEIEEEEEPCQPMTS